ncbi:hypothetical protein NL676_019906 [Syzygium grande]|nr:hypothetical protein NL676_019906 [Syzygium grande]
MDPINEVVKHDRQNMDPIEFVKQYYKMLDEKPAYLENMYREGSRLTFEGERIKGKEGILAKLICHPFTRYQHSINSVDCHPSDAGASDAAGGGRIVLVTGVLGFDRLDGERQALNFTQTFQLMPSPEGGFYILNDIFRVDETTTPQSQVMEGVPARVATVIHT